jgi:nicotinamide-nucleotide amidase
VSDSQAQRGRGLASAAGREDRRNRDFEKLAEAVIMIVDDEPIVVEVTRSQLEEGGYTRFVTTSDPEEAIGLLLDKQPDVLLLDLMMPQMSGFDVLAQMNSEDILKDVPTIVLTSSKDPGTKLKALELGATDFLSKPVDSGELLLRLRNTLAAKAYRDHLANYDLLTGTPNRRMFMDRLEWALSHAERSGHHAAVLQVGLDDFGKINARLGPRLADVVLQRVAQRLENCLRTTDTVLRLEDGPRPSLSRFSGDEFTFLLPLLRHVDDSARIAERILGAVATPFHVSDRSVALTCSIGVAIFPADAQSGDRLVSAAAVAMQRAKDAGKNAFRFFAGEPTAPVPRTGLRVEVICTGDEVLTGKIVNTNFSYITQKLEDFGLSVRWETTVGDDRDDLLLAFKLAADRADAVIVNGGLGPTVDDLSQEIAAKAAGVELVLSKEWLSRMESYFARRSRVMPPNNVKQAMLPQGAEVLDNPVGTACGFALDIGQARFYFTPGVPRELRRMLEGEIVPRLLAKSGIETAVHLKRFHSYGIGESHADSLLAGVTALAPDASVKLGFRAHYPQLETKLTVRGRDMDDIRAKLAPVENEVRKRLGNFILAEDDLTLEGVVLDALASRGASLALVETFTSGQIAGRIAHLPGAEKVFRRGIVARDLAEVCGTLGLQRGSVNVITRETAETIARTAQQATGSSHALAVLVDLDEGADRIEFAGTICLAVASDGEVASRRSRIVGGRDWVRLGAVEMGLDCLRRYLQGLPVYERIDFEKVEPAQRA